MSIEVTVPNLPESVSDATIAAWHKKPGDTVNKNDSLVDLETDKVVLEVTAPESGVLTEVLAEQGAIVLAGQVIGVLDTEKRAATVSSPSVASADVSAPTNADITPLSPSVRRLINENTLNPADIKGTGKKWAFDKIRCVRAYTKASGTYTACC
nr:biotin/lipoyl-containing protein [Methylocucumis oryzae]